jgi:hypothetical protein
MPTPLRGTRYVNPPLATVTPLPLRRRKVYRRRHQAELYAAAACAAGMALLALAAWVWR